MNEENIIPNDPCAVQQIFTDNFRDLSKQIFDLSKLEVPRTALLKRLIALLADFSKCDFVELRLKENERYCSYSVRKNYILTYSFQSIPKLTADDGTDLPFVFSLSGLDSVIREIVLGKRVFPMGNFTRSGSFWTSDAQNPNVFGRGKIFDLSNESPFSSIAVLPIVISDGLLGFLILKSVEKFFFTELDIQFYEDVCGTLGVAIVIQKTQAELRERIKELTCLHGIAQIVEKPDISLEEILRSVIELIPKAWQYPEITEARIVLDEMEFATPGFYNITYAQTSEIVVGDEVRGAVQVVYSERLQEFCDWPFLEEEQRLLDIIASEIGLIVEKRIAHEERKALQEQLRHADRLATLGQLAADVAHELNEPLANILGFAQLTIENPELPPSLKEDIERIVKASLHAREVIKKLLFFGRQMPTKKAEINLNDIVENGLYFLESRCVKEGITVVRELDPKLPKIVADPAQIHQALVNLVVNAIQAMPGGGTLTMRTAVEGEKICLAVEDTGVGMSEKVLKQAFLPFFTTKDIGQGTGLGLPVAHGIITSHGGSVEVKSELGIGSRFEVFLPISPETNKEIS